MDTKCLYADLLGDHFELLPPALREFHRRGERAAGTFDVERGSRRFITQTFADMMGIPAAASKVNVGLDIHRCGQKETWNRWFGSRLMRTRQWACSGLLVEQVGVIRMGFRVAPIERGLMFECVECRGIGVLMPGFLRPNVRANITGDDDGWLVDVRIDDSRGRLVCRYGGKMWPV